MSMSYMRESGSNFPDSVLSINKFKDIDDSVKDIIMQYYSYISQGEYDLAANLISNHPEISDYWFDTSKINLITEEIYNMGIFINKKRGTIVSDTEPDIEYDNNTVWIKPIGGE